MTSQNFKVWEDEISRRLDAGDELEFTVDSFLQSVGGHMPNKNFEQWLEEKISQGTLRRMEVRLCPMVGCHRPIDESAIHTKICPHCNTDFREEGVEPELQIKYRINGEASKDIYWMIVVHGMNTRGPWQEEINWRLANKFKYSAPVLIYKYGWVTIDVLVKWRHRQLMRKLGEHIREATKYAKEYRNDHPPDIIVHSFGSHLFSLLLESEAFSDLKFGRVITVGSIIHPNFNWKKQIDTGKIDAIFNHVGKKDVPVRVAQFCIPGTGPSGQKGFTDMATINVPEERYGHSSAFTPIELTKNLQSGGLWDRFLQNPLARFCPANAYHLKKWNSFFAPVRWVSRIIGTIVFTVAIIFSVLFPICLIRMLLDS